METTINVIGKAIEWTKEAEKMINEQLNDRIGGKDYANVLEFSQGKKYARLVRRDHAGDKGGSAWAFIDLTNGDVLKCAGWAKPAKHARGNIFTHKPIECCDWTGPHYLK